MLCEAKGEPLTQKVVRLMVGRSARRANVRPGAHILRHAFCSHLAMRGAPAREIQELAGHQDLATTQRYSIRVVQRSTQQSGCSKRELKSREECWMRLELNLKSAVFVTC